MAGIKSLFKDTAIYGMSSIVGRFLNWCLVPMYTYCFSQAQFGVVTYIYAAVALTLVVLTYGMETGYFRFANHEKGYSQGQVYTTGLLSLGFTSVLFMAAGCLLSPQIASWIGVKAHPAYVWMMVVAVGVDAYTSLPFAYLRNNNRAVRFAVLKCTNIAINIGLNLFFILACPYIWEHSPGWIAWFYDPDFGIGYIFLANMISSLATLLMLLPEIMAEDYDFSRRLLKKMLVYSYPIMILGLAGIMNQSIDKLLFPYLIADKAIADAQLGIYGANYKIAIVMVMFLQAFRFAYEPFIFAQNKRRAAAAPAGDAAAAPDSANRSYVAAMNWFVISALFIFLGVMFFLPILKYFISPAYFSGLRVVPIIMLAELFFGVFYNLSVWYKITDATIWGTWFSLMGLGVTLVLNFTLVPLMGYMGCAWAAFCCYGFMMVASYVVGARKHPIPYDLRRLGAYALFAMLLWGLAVLVTTGNNYIDLPLRTLVLLLYVAVVYVGEIRPPKFLKRLAAR